MAVPRFSLTILNEARSVMEVLKPATYSICSTYDEGYCDLVEQHGDVAGERMNSPVDYQQSEPSFKVQCNRGHANSAYDSFTGADMVDVMTM